MHLCRKSVRRFLPIATIMGFGLLIFDIRWIRDYSRPCSRRSTESFKLKNNQIHGYDWQGGYPLVKVWITILREFDNP